MDQDRSYNKIQDNESHIRYEFTNYDTIVFRKSKLFWKAIGNSVVILKIYGAKTKVRSYYNVYYSQEILELSLHTDNMDKVKAWLSVKGSVLLRNDKNYYVIKLKEPISAKRIKTAKNSKEIASEVTQNILYKYRHSTPLLKAVRDIFNETGVVVSRMPRSNGIVLGEFLLTNILELQMHVRNYSRQENASNEQRQDILDKIDDVVGLFVLIPNFLSQSSRILIIGRKLESITIAINKDIEKCKDELSRE